MMNSAMLACAGAFTFSGAVMCVLAVPLMRRRIKPNGLYGLRVPATFADEWVWYEANARAGRDLVGLGVVLALGAFVLPSFGLARGTSRLAWCCFAAAGSLVMAVIGWRRANRLLLERRREHGKP